MPSDEQRADISDLFAAGKAGMQVVGHWRVQCYLGSGFDMVALPLGESGQAVNRADGSFFAIPADNEHTEEARELVKYLAASYPVAAEISFATTRYMTILAPAFASADTWLTVSSMERKTRFTAT